MNKSNEFDNSRNDSSSCANSKRGSWREERTNGRALICTRVADAHQIVFFPSAALMVRKLKHHEQKLLKKVDFLNVRLLSLHPGHYQNLRLSVETRCEPPRDKGSPSLPHPKPRGLSQIQQIMRFTAIACTPPLHAPGTRPFSLPNGGPDAFETVRHGGPELNREALRH